MKDSTTDLMKRQSLTSMSLFKSIFLNHSSDFCNVLGELTVSTLMRILPLTRLTLVLSTLVFFFFFSLFPLEIFNVLCMPRLVLPNFVGSRWQRNCLGNTMDCGPCCLPNQGWKTCDPWGIRCHHKSTGYLYCMVERGSFFWLNWLPDMASYFLTQKKKKLSGMIDWLTMSIIIIQASWFSSLKACRRFFFIYRG